MAHIALISSSVRTGRNSHRVATYLKNYIEANQLATIELLDLHEYNFPIFEERLKYQKDPLPKAIEFSNKIKAADGVIIVTPEYNGGYPASIKNAVDLLIDEWYRKPIALASVSAGPFGGAQVLTSLQFSLWKIKALMVPTSFQVANVGKSYDENAVPADKEGTDKRAGAFVAELLWWAEAKAKMS